MTPAESAAIERAVLLQSFTQETVVVEGYGTYAGAHRSECWLAQLAGSEECRCGGSSPSVARPLAALLDATADTPAVAA